MNSKDNEIQKILSEIYGMDVKEFVVVARSSNEEDLKYSYKGNTVVLSGLLSWFGSFIHSVGFKSTYIDPSKN